MRKIVCICFLFLIDFTVDGQSRLKQENYSADSLRNIRISSINFKGMSLDDSLLMMSILFADTHNFYPPPIHSDTSYFGKKYEIFVDTATYDDTTTVVRTYLNKFELSFERTIGNKGPIYFTSEIKGKRTGIFPYYYPNGSLMSIQAYIFDIEVGDWLEYYPEGELKSIKVYDFEYSDFFLPPREYVHEAVSQDNCCDSFEYLGPTKMPKRAEYYYCDGSIERIEYYKNKKKVGTWKYFTVYGKLKKEEEYQNGVLLKTKLY